MKKKKGENELCYVLGNIVPQCSGMNAFCTAIRFISILSFVWLKSIGEAPMHERAAGESSWGEEAKCCGLLWGFKCLLVAVNTRPRTAADRSGGGGPLAAAGRDDGTCGHGAVRGVVSANAPLQHNPATILHSPCWQRRIHSPFRPASPSHTLPAIPHPTGRRRQKRGSERTKRGGGKHTRRGRRVKNDLDDALDQTPRSTPTHAQAPCKAASS